MVIVDDGTRVPMTRSHDAGIFEATIDRPDIISYRLEIHLSGGAHNTRFSILIPICRPSAISICIYGPRASTSACMTSSGAHLREMRGAHGVAFAVWAPNARGVSVIGDFNGWDGRLHMMRTLGSSGVWEIFVPEVGEGTKYKYEIRTRDGDLLLKSDPFATLMEVPPAHRIRRMPTALSVPRSRMDGRARIARYPQNSGLDLRGASRLVAAQARRESSLAQLSRARERAGRLRRGHGLHAHRADAGDGASVWRLMGISGQRLFRADLALRLARRLPLLRRRDASARHRRDSRLGARAFSDRRVQPRALRRHRAVRASRSAQRVTIRSGTLTSSTTAAARSAASSSRARSTGSANATSMGCASMRSRR